MKQNSMPFLELIAYAIVGATVTVLNILLYYVLSRFTSLHYTAANVLAFVMANIYAFFANKIFVFYSRSFALKTVATEFLGFATARGASCVMDLAIMYVGVSLLTLSDMWVKAVSSVIIIVLNYVASKFMIFRKGGKTT